MRSYKFYLGTTIQDQNMPDFYVRNHHTTIMNGTKAVMTEFDVQGYTIFKTSGYWQGIEENALCIEIITDGLPLASFMKRLKELTYQSCIVSTVSEVNFYEI